jgi:3-keto-5-aminohexanoate cleavage enzyme
MRAVNHIRPDAATPWPPLILAVAPTGARKTKADHVALPMSATEIAEAAAACRDVGASLIHLHVRDRDGRHTLDPDAYRAAMAAIHRAVGTTMIVQITTEAGGRYRAVEQMQAVREVRPEAVSLAIAELIPDEATEAAAGEFLAWLAREGIVPQYILYSVDDLVRFKSLRRRGVVPGERPFVLFVLGRYDATKASAPVDLLPFLHAGVDALDWAVCAFGARENACMLTAATLGGHCRVGFENNLVLGDGTPAPDNAALVAQVAAGARLIGRQIADADTARALLSLRDSHVRADQP